MKLLIKSSVFGIIVVLLNALYIGLDPDDDEFVKNSLFVRGFASIFRHTILNVEETVLGLSTNGWFNRYLIYPLNDLLRLNPWNPFLSWMIIFAFIFTFWTLFAYLTATVCIKYSSQTKSDVR